MKKKKFILLPFVAILLAIGIAVNILYPLYYMVLVVAFGDVSSVSSDEYKQQTLAESKEIAIRIEEEGAVLLKNEGNALPVQDTRKINVYGTVSGSIITGSSGSASGNQSAIGLKTALESVGFEVNSALWNLVEANAPDNASSKVDGGISRGFEIEPGKYNSACSWAEAKSYSDYALFTIGSLGGEGDDAAHDALALDENETALLTKLDEEGFKVITLINSSAVMELGPVIEHSDAILWIGGTGTYGAYGVADILAGEANPSGRLSDTWTYDQSTSSSYYSAYNTADSYYVVGGTARSAYTNYNEGIYVGYKWYETADAEGYWSDYPNGYDDVVAYPFGYGLSYTEFKEEIVSVTHENGTFTFEIKATNVGSVAGKDVIELYVEKPYVNGGVEVAKVELVGFEKTEALAATKGNQTVKITVADEDLASYDSTANGGKGCYVLADGEYKFYLASATQGAHSWKSISDSVAANGSSSRYYSYIFNEKTEYNESNPRTSDAVAAVNRLDVTDNESGVASTDATAGFNELSRKDGFANAAQTISEAANPNGKVTADNTAIGTAVVKYIGAGTENNADTGNLASVNEFGDDTRVSQPKVYTLEDLYTTDGNGNASYTTDLETGEKIILSPVDYDDPRWAELISQMSGDEMMELLGRAQYGTIAIDSIGKIEYLDNDGPLGLTSFVQATLGIEQNTTMFSTEPVMASTWNKELMKELGKAVGKEANAFNQMGWYAPGLNMHRTPFEGRAAEYFSEDSYLSGYMAAYEVMGAASKGVLCYAKHFAFNDTEQNRSSSVNANISEQAAREIYLRPFEIAVKVGGLSGLMSSFASINGQWVGGNYNLMTNIVRGEWGFKGSVTTDTYSPAIMSALKAVCGGGADMLLSGSFSLKNSSLAPLRLDTLKNSDGSYSDEAILALKTAAKHTLYAYAKAAQARDIDAITADISALNAVYVAINVVAYGGAAVLLGLFTFFLVKDLRRIKASKACRVETDAAVEETALNE